MVLNYIWIGFFIIAFIFAIIRFIGYYYRDFFFDIFSITFDNADLNVFSDIMTSTFSSAKTSIEVSIYLIGVMTLWLGIMKIGENGGAINALSRLVGPFFQKLFPEIPKNHPVFGSMLMNISANMLGLDNAATPLGLKAMGELQEENKTKDTASNAQIMFLVLNASGLTIIPISILAIRAASGSANPTEVFIPILIATFAATLAGLTAVAIRQKINLFDKVIMAYLGSAIALILGMVLYFRTLSPDKLNTVASFGGNFLIFSIIITFILLALRKKINIYESFIEGAKDGFNVAVKIIPYLVAMLVAIGVFRASGALDILNDFVRHIVAYLGYNTDFVDALPTLYMKPLSGSGSRGMMVETISNFGVDSFAARLSAIFQGSTETTFYIIAVYYGAVGVKRTRYTVGCGLIADLAGAITAIFVAYLFFH